MARTNIIEYSENQVIELYTGKFFRPVFASTPPIPANYDGKYACLAVIATDTQLSEAQMDALETAVENITGVYKSFVLIGPARIPVDRTPVNHDLTVGVEASFDIKPIPVE